MVPCGFASLENSTTVARGFCLSGTSLRRYTVSKFGKAVCGLILFCAMSICASAQSSTAAMFGSVTDSTGALISKATVILTQTDTGFVRTITTEGDGSYRADFLPVGPYKVSVTAQGFKKLEQEGVT